MVRLRSGRVESFLRCEHFGFGCFLAVDSSVMEDATWLRRKASDASYINVAALDAVLKSVNLALKWKLRAFEIMTDSVRVYIWMRSVITTGSRINTKGSAEMLIRRRLSDLRDLISQFGLTMNVYLFSQQRIGPMFSRE